MSDDYFTHTVELKPGTKARAEDVNYRFNGVATSLKKLPAPHPSSPGFSEPIIVTTPEALSHAVSLDDVMGGSALLFGEDSGSANFYDIDLPVPPESYRDGLRISFTALHANTGPSVVNINNLGQKNLYRSNGTDLVSGDIVAGQVSEFIYSANAFRATSALGNQLDQADRAESAADRSETAAASLMVCQHQAINCSGLSTVNLNCGVYDTFELTNINQNITINFTNTFLGRTGVVAISGTGDVTFGGTVSWPGGIVFEKTEGQGQDLVAFTVMSSGVLASVVPNFL